jgi:pyruvate,water dikinase
MQSWIDGEEKAIEKLRGILRRLGVEVDKCIEVLQCGVDHETSRMNRALRELAVVAAREGKNEHFYRQLDNFLERFGHFESNWKLLCDSPETIEMQVDQMVQAGVGTHIEYDPERRAESLLQELLLQIPHGRRQQAFLQAVKALRHWIALRENSKSLTQLPLPLLKRLLGEAGRRLTRRRILSNPEDVKLLTLAEFRNALEGCSIDKELLRRREKLIQWKNQEHPSWLPQGFLGKPCGRDDPILHGEPASPGVAEGPARIVLGPEQFGEVRQGDVVVARSTSPVWTQLFTRIAAIVVESGSRLSHAAVVAREFGIPAVVAIPGVVAAIHNGERLRVEGTVGKVFRLDLPESGQ